MTFFFSWYIYLHLGLQPELLPGLGTSNSDFAHVRLDSKATLIHSGSTASIAFSRVANLRTIYRAILDKGLISASLLIWHR